MVVDICCISTYDQLFMSAEFFFVERREAVSKIKGKIVINMP